MSSTDPEAGGTAEPEQAAPEPGGTAEPEHGSEQAAPEPGGTAEPEHGSEQAAPEPGAIEAILLVTDEPLSAVTLAQVLDQPVAPVERVLVELSAEYSRHRRGFDLREVAGGWRFYTREEYAPLVEKFVLDGQQTKLTQAALETLAVVAYRQPVSRARVSAVRGVNCDGVMKTLITRGLVTEAGVDSDTGATLFATTGYFLERLGLGSLEELPDLAPYLPDIDEMEQLADGVRGSRTGGDQRASVDTDGVDDTDGAAALDESAVAESPVSPQARSLQETSPEAPSPGATGVDLGEEQP